MYRIIFNKDTNEWLPEAVTKTESIQGKCYETLSEASRVATERNEGTTNECKDCHRPFAVTPEEARWYQDKGYDLPKRCHACRKKRRNAVKAKEGIEE